MSIREFGNELLTGLLAFTVESVPGAVGAGISVAADMTSGDNGCLPGAPDQNSGETTAETAAPRSVAAVGVATQLDPAQWAHATGPIWEAFRSGRLVLRPEIGAEASDRGSFNDIGIAGLEGLIPGHADSVRGAVFLAGEWGGELPVVLSIYLDRPPDSTVLRDIDRYEPLVTQALAVVEYCAGEEQVAQQMLQMTQYRRVIEQAKGLVMGAIGGDSNSAFATLARASQHFNIRLRNLAVALVEHVGKGDAEHPDDPELVVQPTNPEREIAARVWAALTITPAIMGPAE
ncbi:MAG TPA: ANTAR domain-containing protein [Kineosporiaceae bacterium]|nr:ANTAR domain-containing protein [Kineosporiaceae bacterium]